MTSQSSELLEKIRQQFDSAPYPRVPVDQSPKDSANLLYIHNLITSYYLRNQKAIESKGKVILDAGCGTGYKSLILAHANPEAKIVGIDISEESIKLARQRLEYHGYENTEFYVLKVEDLPKLNYRFDYINCDELLYLFPKPVIALQVMKDVLQHDGIIRSNLHSAIQRANFFRGQKLFKMMGLMDDNPEELEIETVRETMKALKDSVRLKASTWNSAYEEEDNKESILLNYLFQGDAGYTIADLFTALREAELEFISMVNWREWNLMDLFKEPNNLPAYLELSLPEISVEQRLQLFEFLHPIHRLLDFWCGHPDRGEFFVPVIDWTASDWGTARVYLHPQLKTSDFTEELLSAVREVRTFAITEHLSLIEKAVIGIESTMAVCLIPLLEESQSMMSLVEYWLQVRPVDPVTLKPTDRQYAFSMVQKMIQRLESFGYILLERQF